MAREIAVLWAGRHQKDAWEILCGEYRQRIGHHVTIRDIPVRVSTSSSDSARRQKEGDRLLSAAPDPSWTIALDSGGKAMSSERWAETLLRLRQEWAHPIAFFVGSDLGLDPKVLQRARLVLSFGPMTLPHTLARLVLYEQIYRGLSIGLGINYHRPRL